MINWLSKYKFQSHLAAFLLMVLTSIGLYLAIDADTPALTWGLLSGFAVANFLAVLVK